MAFITLFKEIQKAISNKSLAWNQVMKN